MSKLLTEKKADLKLKEYEYMLYKCYENNITKLKYKSILLDKRPMPDNKYCIELSLQILSETENTIIEVSPAKIKALYAPIECH